MANTFYLHAILGSDGDPGLSKALLVKRLKESGMDFLDLENGYLDVVIDVDQTRVPELERILQRVADKTGVVWNVPYDAEIHDEVGAHHTLRWSQHPWGMRVEADDEMLSFALALDGSVARHYPHATDHLLVDLPLEHLEALREHAGIGIDPGDIDWAELLGDEPTWAGSAFAMFASVPETDAERKRAAASHTVFVELLTQAGVPLVEIAPGYIELKVRGVERKDQLVLLGIMAQVERLTAFGWRNPADPVWLEYKGRDHEFQITLHEAFTRVETEEAWEHAQTLPGAETHVWPDGTVAGVDFWFQGDKNDVGKDVMSRMVEWAGPRVD